MRRRRPFTIHPRVYSLVPSKLAASAHLVACPVVTYRQFLSLVKRADVPLIRFHDLRHTAATLPLLQGINVKVISEILGDSSITITLNLYGHVLPDMQQQAADAMKRILRGKEL